MKKLIKLSLCAGLWLGLTLNSPAALLEEGFDYPVGNLPSPWSGPGTRIQITSGGLTLPPLLDTSPAGNKVTVDTDGADTRTQSRNFTGTPITNGTVYAGFLLRCGELPTANTYLISMVQAGAQANGGTDEITLYTSALGAGYRLGVRHPPAGAIYATNELALNTTYFVAMKYTFGGGGRAEIYILPTPSGTEPITNNALIAGGTEAPNLQVISMKAQSADTQGIWDIDTLRIGSTWADVSPVTGACIPASVSVPPANAGAYVGGTAKFSCGGSGTPPLNYQWQSTNNAGSFTNISGATNSIYQTPVVSLADNGKKYRCIVSVTCSGGSSATSSVASLAVSPLPVYTGVLVNDTWQDGTLTDPAPPAYSETGVDADIDTDIESAWFAGGFTSSPGLSSQVGVLLLTPQSASSRTWLTHFTSNAVAQVAPGGFIKATLIFTPGNVTDNTNSNFRFGLFDYALAGGLRLPGNVSSANAQGTDTKGYAFDVNFSSTFHVSSELNTLTIRTRTNLISASLMANTEDYASIGTWATNDAATGFVGGSIYTNVMTIARNSGGTSVTVTATITGPNGFLITLSAVDSTSSNYINFDTYALRPTSSETTTDGFTVHRFTVEVVAGTGVTPIPLNIQRSGSNVILTWTNAAFNLRSATTVNGTYGLISGATSPYQVPITNSARFFRLQNP